MIKELSRERLMELLTDLVACDSVSCTGREIKAEHYVYDFLKQLPYFRQHENQFGLYRIPDDPFGRAIPYGLVLGKKRDTVILSGHLDVVGAEVYGNAQPLAYTIGPDLEAALSKMNLTRQQREDLESGRWIWGRGAADMKAGVALNMHLLETYADMAMTGDLDGSILFLAVADEESYSAGMRAIIPEMLDLKKKYELDFKLLINPEPAAERESKQVMSLGSIAKTMPVIMTQGVLTHIGHSYDGISALNMLTGIYRRTNGSLDFVDYHEGEASMPPAWLAMRDLKDAYDVSLPFRAYGCISMLSFTTTLGRIIGNLKRIAIEVFEEEVDRLNREYRQFKKGCRFETKEEIRYETRVYTVEELRTALCMKNKAAFDAFYAKIYETAGQQIAEGKSYLDATVYMMEQILDFADMDGPVILIGAAPPYYPAAHSDRSPGREGFGSGVFEYIREISEREYHQELTYEHYFTGISDNSYTAAPGDSMEFGALTGNYPLWGSLYDIDFQAIGETSVPAILYGPIGREYHQRTERLDKRSFLEVMPNTLQYVIQFAWEYEDSDSPAAPDVEREV